MILYMKFFIIFSVIAALIYIVFLNLQIAYCKFWVMVWEREISKLIDRLAVESEIKGIINKGETSDINV